VVSKHDFRLLAPVRLEVCGHGLDRLVFGSRRVAVNFHPRFPRTPSHTTLENDTFGIEGVEILDSLSDLRKRHAISPVYLEHASKNDVGLLRDRKNGRKEIERVSQVSLEGRIRNRGRFPGITTGGQIQKDDT